MQAQTVKMCKRAEKLETEFPVNSVWQHYNGLTYVVIGVANIANYNQKHRPVIVYKSEFPSRSLLPSRIWTKTPASFRKKLTKLTRFGVQSSFHESRLNNNRT